jgi:hypothetical protein
MFLAKLKSIVDQFKSEKSVSKKKACFSKEFILSASLGRFNICFILGSAGWMKAVY